MTFTGKERVEDLEHLSKVEEKGFGYLSHSSARSRGICTLELALVQPKDAGLV